MERAHTRPALDRLRPLNVLASTACVLRTGPPDTVAPMARVCFLLESPWPQLGTAISCMIALLLWVKSSEPKVHTRCSGTVNLMQYSVASRTDHRLSPSSGPIGRNTRGGRVWEGFGPDPYLAGVALNSTVAGTQAAGVQTSAKHYIANEQEKMRQSTTSSNGTLINSASSNVDDRTLHELYIWPFVSVEHNPPFSRATSDAVY
jgi:hypothetical protein